MLPNSINHLIHSDSNTSNEKYSQNGYNKSQESDTNTIENRFTQEEIQTISKRFFQLCQD